MSVCTVVTLKDGTQVRVQGDIDRDHLEALAATVREMQAKRCKAISDVPMPAIAQRVHKRENYQCGLDRGHFGPHCWPEDGRLAKWTDSAAPPRCSWGGRGR